MILSLLSFIVLDLVSNSAVPDVFNSTDLCVINSTEPDVMNCIETDVIYSTDTNRINGTGPDVINTESDENEIGIKLPDPPNSYILRDTPSSNDSFHDDVIKWKHFPRHWPFVRGIHRSRWIPHTKASDAELWCFLWSAPE